MSVMVDYHNPDISKVRCRLDGDGVHAICNLNSLRSYVGFALSRSLTRSFLTSGQDVYTRKLRRGLTVQIFEI